ITSLGSTGFANTTSYAWRILSATGGIDGFDPQKFNLDMASLAPTVSDGRSSIEECDNALGEGELWLRYISGPDLGTAWPSAANAYHWEVNDATGAPGADPGWDLIRIAGSWHISGFADHSLKVDVVSGVGPSAIR